ncbi:hypothetical protein TSUD_152040 [Trifolium subterraneum]|uniref:Reverse transcriptase zinc-binding domain-containing protein n=1 Tax=Trifolium subterraneum TaxID=3900 RepID=A0A2Z6NN23_TRISU|nr:hypothetical protein TSUD_152040 [Trifolium subterraneum]
MFRGLQEFRGCLLVISHSEDEDVQKLNYEGLSEVNHSKTNQTPSSDWFSKGVLKRVGDEGSSSFWFDPWVGDIPLKIQFQSLFQLSDQQLDLVGEMGYWLNLEWHWMFRWRRDLSVLEIGLLEALLSVVQTTPLLGVVDSWSWRHDSTGTYSVKSAYMVLLAGSVASDLDSLLALLWKSWAPSKVTVFS